MGWCRWLWTGCLLESYLVLSKATQKDRLSSDTFKRGNLGLFGFSVLGVAALPGEAVFWPHPTPAIATAAILTIVRIVGVVVSIWGWRYGILKGVSQDVARTISEDSRVQEQKKSLFYRNALLLVSFSMFSSIME
jgi:NhaP-type Na+/H+ or K+/H+ antiporter